MKKILVPTDFSEVAKNAERYAFALAKKPGAEILIFHAGMGKGNTELNALRSETAQALSGPSAVRSHLISDKKFNAESLNEVVREQGADLVVMGTVGENAGIGKKLFGSNAVAMLDGCEVPVLLVPPDVHFSGIDTIAYASDLWNIDAEIPRLVDFAREFGAKILVFHVGPVFPDLGDVEKMDKKQKMDDLRKATGYADISFSEETTTFDNQVKRGVEVFLNRSQADLLVMFHEKRSGFDKLFVSSHATNAAAHLKKPLLVFSRRV